MKKLLITCVLLLFTLMTSQVFGSTITFNYDNTIYWDGWKTNDTNNNTGVNTPGHEVNKDTSDTWGNPNITGGTATINNAGYLTQVTFNVTSTDSNDWQYLLPADLFIDTNNDKTWDYVVNMIGNQNNAANRGLYQISGLNLQLSDTTNGNYILSDTILGHLPYTPLNLNYIEIKNILD